MKAKLPLGKKAKDEDEEFEEHEDDSDSSRNDDATDATDLSSLEEDDEEEELSIVDKIKKKIKSFQKKSSKDEDEESEASDEEDDEEAKKKKKSKIIQIAIGVALVIFLLSDYIFPPEEPVTSEGTEEIIPEPKTETPQVTDTTPEPVKETPTEVVTEEPVAATPETPADPSVATETTPDSPVDVTSTVSPEPVTEPETTPPVTDIPTTTDSDIEPQPDLSLDSPDTVSDIPIEETPGESGEDIVGEDMSQGTDENLTDQILQDLEKQAKGTTKAESKKEYVAPPDYEYRGRGLVYNCTGKHWACVDAPSYKTCEDNASSVSYLKKTVECHPFNVYETTKGCESMQNRMVSSSAKTTFCNE